MSADPHAVIDAMLRHVEALCDLLTVYRIRAERAEEERDALAARVAELEAHVGSLHKATAAGRDAERAAVVAWLRRPGICGPYGLTGIADAIARGEHRQEDDPNRPLDVEAG